MDGKAPHPSMRTVSLKPAFEVLLLNVWGLLFFITDYNVWASRAFAYVQRKLDFIHLGSPITKHSDPFDL